MNPIDERIAAIQQVRLALLDKQRELDSIVSSLTWAKEIIMSLKSPEEIISLVTLLLPEVLKRLYQIDPDTDIQQLEARVLRVLQQALLEIQAERTQ